MPSLRHIMYYVIRHSVVCDDEEYLFSMAFFNSMSYKEIFDIPEMTIVKEGHQCIFSSDERIITYEDYYQNRDGFVYHHFNTRRHSNLFTITCPIRDCFAILDEFTDEARQLKYEEQKKVLELARKEREKLMYCAIKPAKRDIE